MSKESNFERKAGESFGSARVPEIIRKLQIHPSYRPLRRKDIKTTEIPQIKNDGLPLCI
jgi:hypothetical protein